MRLPAVTLAPVLIAAAGLAGSAQVQRPWPPPVQQVPADAPPLSPEAALRTFSMPPGYRLELVASEPMVEDPIWLDIDPDGRFWVVEMQGFMPTAEERNTTRAPVCRVVVLEDDDDDGTMDRRTVFLDKLVLPRSLKVLDRGVLVAEPPNLWLARDTDGDLVADTKELVRDDYGRLMANPEHNANGLLWGLDNWIYTSEHDGHFRVRKGQLEHHKTVSRGQWGLTMDDVGRIYRNWNEQPAFVDLVPGRYYARNPNLVRTRGSYEMLMEPRDMLVWPIRPTRGVNRGYREGTLRPDGTLTTYVSAGTPTVYRGDRLPAELHGNLFVTEPAGNLVHRLILDEAGGELRARNAYKRGEFLASTDERFRPVNLYSAPDGTLYVVDMYRGIVQEGAYQTHYLRNYIKSHKLDVPLGLGRIYRVMHRSTTRAPKPRLSAAPPAKLVELLAHPNGWWRDTAQRLLVERGAAGVVPALKDLALDAPDHRTRLHALWTLEGLGRLDPSLVALALGDPEPGVRENALQLAEAALPGPAAAREAVTKGILALERDPDPRVRLQLLATLGSADTPDARAAHERLLFAHLDDDWMQVAGLSASSDRAMALLQRALRRAGSGAEPGSRPLDILARETPGGVRLLERLASVVASRGRAGELDAVIHAVSSGGSDDAWWSAALLRGMARTLRAQAESRLALRARQPTLVSLAEAEAASVRRGALELLRQAGFDERQDAGRPLLRAVTIAQSPAESADRRADALQLLRIAGAAPHASWLTKLIDPAQPEPVQRAAIEALGTVRGPDIGSVLLARWSTLTPPVRSAAADAMLADEARVQQLLGALRAGTVPSWSLDFWQKRRLLMNRNPAVRADSRALLEERPAERQAIVERYAAALNLQGDAARGREVFARACAACHRIDATGGGELGPDLATVRHKPLSALLTDILVPSKAIAQRYETYLVERVDGRQEVGVLAEETPTSVTLRHQGGDVVVSRQDIRRMSVVPQSSMPPDLDKVIDPREMADLLTFIARR